MGWAGSYRYRRLAAVLALVGIGFHATILSWHGALRFGFLLEEALLTGNFQVICHSPSARASPPAVDGAAPQSPSAPGIDCPICTAVAAAPLVLLAAAELGLIERVPIGVIAPPADDAAVDSAGPLPRSRGPPLTA